MELSVQSVSKSFGPKLVLDNISFEAKGGSALGLLGRNGAGKTTTIRIIMQVFPSDSGAVEIDGRTVKGSGASFGYMPEERGLFPERKIIEQLRYLGNLYGMSDRQAKQSAAELLERLGVLEYLDKKLSTLSKGNQQKIQLAATLIADPDIVILDEPFSGLDPVNSQLLKDLVDGLISRGKIVIFSSHQMSYVEEFCEDIVILSGGKVSVSGKLLAIKRSFPRNRIEIRTPHAVQMQAFLRDKAGAAAESLSADGDSVSVTLAGEGDKHSLLSAVAQSGIDIDCFGVAEPTLSDIFVKYTEGGI